MLGSVLGSGCQKKEGSSDAPTTPDPAVHPQVLAHVMDYKISPFARGRDTDEEAFRYALLQLREMAPPDPAFTSGPRPWATIVDDMLSSKSYNKGCQECHTAYLQPYKKQYENRPITWVDKK